MKYSNTTIVALSMLFGVILGSLLGGYYVYKHLTYDHVKLYETNIGYWAFKNGKIYSLEELKNLH